MRRKTIFLQSFLIVVVSFQLNQVFGFEVQPMGFYSRTNSITYAEIMSIDAFIDDFKGTIEPGRTALTHDLAEWGVRYGPWQLGRIFRYDYDLEFSHDTAQINQWIERNVPIDSERDYHVFLDVEHLRSQGLRLARVFKPVPTVELVVGVSWLESEQFYSGSIDLVSDRGSLSDQVIAQLEQRGAEIEASAQQAQQADEIISVGEQLSELNAELEAYVETTTVQGRADYYYYEAALREDESSRFNHIDFSHPRGSGLTIDVDLHWQINSHWSVAFSVVDLFSRIEWQQSPATRGEFNATAAAKDVVEIVDQFVEEDIIKRLSGGFYQSINPDNPDRPQDALPGIAEQIKENNSEVFVRNERFNQKLTRQIKFTTAFASGRWWAASGAVEHYHTYTFYHGRLELFNHLALEWHPKVNAVGIELFHPLAKLRLVSDTSDYEKAKYLSLMAQLQVVF